MQGRQRRQACMGVPRADRDVTARWQDRRPALHGAKLGTHRLQRGRRQSGRQPTWCNANDIPWLKLTVTSGRGTGILSGVTTVQRINTVGGKLEGDCEKVGHLSQRARLRGLRVPAQGLNAFAVITGKPDAKTRFAPLPGHDELQTNLGALDWCASIDVRYCL